MKTVSLRPPGTALLPSFPVKEQRIMSRCTRISNPWLLMIGVLMCVWGTSFGTITFSNKGQYKITCNFHPDMLAYLTVQ